MHIHPGFHLLTINQSGDLLVGRALEWGTPLVVLDGVVDPRVIEEDLDCGGQPGGTFEAISGTLTGICTALLARDVECGGGGVGRNGEVGVRHVIEDKLECGDWGLVEMTVTRSE
jgi:hypothetical protein